MESGQIFFGGSSVGIAVEPLKESVVGVVPKRFSFLGRPQRGKSIIMWNA